MANYYATARSNYFRVKDIKAFTAWCDERHLDIWTQNYEGVGLRYAISPEPYYESGWPRSDFDEDTDEEIEFDLAAELAGHLDPRDIAVLIQIGNEKLRYLTGEAIAIHSSGKTACVSLNEIYAKAFELAEGDITVTDATY